MADGLNSDEAGIIEKVSPKGFETGAVDPVGKFHADK